MNDSESLLCEQFYLVKIGDSLFLCSKPFRSKFGKIRLLLAQYENFKTFPTNILLVSSSNK